MRRRQVQVAPALLVALAFVIAGCGGGSPLSLRAVERAFYNAKIPFVSDWQRHATNPYLTRRAADNPTAQYPQSFARHITGWAGFINPRTFVNREALVFDDSSSAAAFARWWGQHSTGNQTSYLTAKNVVYIGQSSRAVTRVIEALRG